MADALCGPVNPLSSFQKHTQKDRTLQNDRLVSRAGPSQGFRSPAPNAGLLDPEFEAFQAGFPAAAPISTPSPFFQPNFPARFQTPPIQTAPSPVPDWAVDFQRLNLSTPSPVHSLKERHAHSSSISAPPMMHNPMMNEPVFQNPVADHINAMSMMGAGFGPGVGMGYMPGEQHTMLHRQEPTSAPVFDDATFAAAFDSAAAFLQPSTKGKEPLAAQNNEYEALLRSEEELDQIMGDYQTHESAASIQHAFAPVTSMLHEPQQETKLEETPKLSDGDALARTAGELLNSVSHDTSDKFAQSSFMALMRSLRDKAVKVDGENFVDSSTNDIMNTTGVPSSMEDIEPDANATAGGNITRPSETWEPIASPARPLTPEIDPPAPTLEMWRKRLLG